MNRSSIRVAFTGVAAALVLSACGGLLPGALPGPGTSLGERPVSAATPAPDAAAPQALPGGISKAAARLKAKAALKVLNTIPVKGRAPKTGYTRDKFGNGWGDLDHDGCSTREEILRRDLTSVQYVDSRHCKVKTGTLLDPYTGQTITYVRGMNSDPEHGIDVDHVVALSDAWQKGAQNKPWTLALRTQFANDPLNLRAVGLTPNRDKGDADAATWLPCAPSKDKSKVVPCAAKPAQQTARCDYVERQIVVKRKYPLWVTQAEKDAMVRVLTPCAA